MIKHIVVNGPGVPPVTTIPTPQKRPPQVSRMGPRPTLIFVHGAWHTPEFWKLVIPDLEADGHRCVHPQLIFCGTEHPIDSIKPAIEQVQSLISAEVSSGRDVILITHSFGGSVGSSAVKGLTRKDPSNLTSSSTGRVVGLIQIAAFLPPTGVSLHDVLADRSHEPFHHSYPDGWELIDNGDPRKLFYHDLSPDEAETWIKRIVKQSSGAMSTREGVYAGWADVPVWYLVCLDDQAMPVHIQEGMVEAARRKGADITTRRVDSGHSPCLSKPKEVVEFISEAVAAVM